MFGVSAQSAILLDKWRLDRLRSSIMLTTLRPMYNVHGPPSHQLTLSQSIESLCLCLSVSVSVSLRLSFCLCLFLCLSVCLSLLISTPGCHQIVFHFIPIQNRTESDLTPQLLKFDYVYHTKRFFKLTYLTNVRNLSRPYNIRKYFHSQLTSLISRGSVFIIWIVYSSYGFLNHRSSYRSFPS